MSLLFEKSKPLREIMLGVVHDSLKRNQGNKTKAAKELGVTPRCVRKWISKFEELSDFRNQRIE